MVTKSEKMAVVVALREKMVVVKGKIPFKAMVFPVIPELLGILDGVISVLEMEVGDD